MFKFISLASIFSSLFLPVHATQPGQTLKVLTLNFNSEPTPVDGRYALRNWRYSAIVDWIFRNDPDIILMQEGWNFHGDSSVAKTIAKAVGYDVAYRLDMGFPGYMYDSDAVLAKKSLHMSDERHVKLPHSAWDIGNGRDWIIVFGKVSYAVGVKLTLDSGAPIYVYSAHLIGDSDNDRADQIKALNYSIRKQVVRDGGDWNTAKVIIGGDMNSHPDSPSMTFLRGQGYQDTWAEAHPPYESGNEGWTNCPAPWMPCFNPITIGAHQIGDQDTTYAPERIDYVYTKGRDQKTLASTLEFTAPFDGIWMSDHFGVLSTIAVTCSLPPDGSVPNPLLADAQPPPGTIFDLGAEMFQCSEDDDDCRNAGPSLEVKGARGLTIMNHTGDEVSIHLRGPGWIFTDPDADLDDGQVAGFFFDRPGVYSYWIDDDNGDRLSGTIRVD